VSGMKPQQAVQSDNFVYPDAVYYINGYMTNPHAILGVTLPRTPMWFKQSDRVMILETLQSLHTKEYMSMFFDRIGIIIKRNDLLEIKQVQDQRKTRLIDNTPPELLNAKLREFRERSVKYLANAWNPAAFVSAPIKLMAKASGEMGTWYCGDPVVTDTGMSSFGNFIIDAMFGFENILRISTVHTILLRVFINALDAYRYSFNLHNNVLMVGAGATGKSHILDMVEHVLCLPGSVNKVSHLTDKAMTVDTDSNDVISTFHEMPPILRGGDNIKGGGDNSGAHLIKDMLTSCKVATESIVVEDGRRIAIKASSERVGVMLMASNDPSDQIPEALATRMILIQVNANERDKFSINDMTSEVEGVTGGNYMEKSSADNMFSRKWKVRQILINMVEKMIYIGSLKDANIRVFETVQLKMTGYMKNHDIMQRIGNDRDIKFLKRFARTLTILHGVDKFISDPNSPGYDPHGEIKFGAPESFELLLKIQPYLFCTEEIALFTLTLNADQLIEVHHFQVLEVIMACVMKSLKTQSTTVNDYEEADGFWVTRSSYTDESSICRKLASAQNNSTFKTKMSAENIKVAFRELRHRVYNDHAIIEFSTNTQAISINFEFINKHFIWQDDIGRFVCNFDMNSIMADVFHKSYSNTYTRDHPKSIVGVTYDRELPFLFDTLHKRPNPDHILTRYIAQSNNRKGVDGHEVTAEYERIQDTVRYKINFEDFSYKQYLISCGLNPDNYDVEDTLYNHHVTGGTHMDYPEEHVEWFTKFTGIKPDKKHT
jgi:hypothetical protein